MNSVCPRLVIAGTGSGVGKTSIALGLARALARRGLKVQTFKVGPDFLDPTYLTLASNRTCYNLDAYMTNRNYVQQLFTEKTKDADIAIIEGVMGLFDGASPTSIESSTAEIAIWLNAPVLLVVNTHGVAGSIAATVKGFAEFRKDLTLAGVIANQCGSENHKKILSQALKAANLPELIGGIPNEAFPKLESRHLGLVTANKLDDQKLERLADACQQNLNLDNIINIAQATMPICHCEKQRDEAISNVRIGIAKDEAFHFYYPDNLQTLERLGAELVDFSPISDAALPDNLSCIYFGGGYPEVYAEKLSVNHSMIESIRNFKNYIYAECGGLMYLGEKLCGYPMLNLLPITFTMKPRLRSLGYVEVTLTEDSIWGKKGDTLRGHEFHYSDASESNVEKIYSVKNTSGKIVTEGYKQGKVLASYVHLHFASKPPSLKHFIEVCGGRCT